ncbi:uncharacterized protein LOC111632417 [Centruroides sculpturatus]|uniref:uncharacterized protein LOC111632417 n=1 Tax=Centruroides sculpturatus TaxID=218467 RepID=UPI000C6E31D9|nr:uncharacterized protein LOC111632417 [Centruroides sculpturatus]
MEKPDQNTQCSSKGAFDAASLLAPSSPVFGHHLPVPANAPLFHLAHSPSAFSVLSQTTSLSSHSPTTLSINNKICSQIGTDAHNSFSSSLPGCSTAVTHSHENVGRSELNDMVSLKHGSTSSSLHCHIPQPRRIVEEMLGHLYARPPSAEIKTELPVSGTYTNN